MVSRSMLGSVCCNGNGVSCMWCQRWFVIAMEIVIAVCSVLSTFWMNVISKELDCLALVDLQYI